MIRPEKSRRPSQALSAESELSFVDAFDNAPHAMALVASDGTLVYVNRALCLMLGFSRDELVDANISTITHPDDLETEREQRRRLARADIGRYELTQRYVRKFGEVVWVRQSVSATRRQYQLAHFVVEVEVVAAPACRGSEDTEEQLLRRFGDATLSAMHEIGNTLTPLMVNTELIVEQTHSDQIREFAAEVFKAARRIAFTLRRLRTPGDNHPVAYLGQERMLDLRMLAPKSEDSDGPRNQALSLDREEQPRQN